MSTPADSQQDAPQTPTTPITMTVSGSDDLAHRRFTQADAHFIDALLREGPFDEVEWTVDDQQGTTKGTQLAAVLHNVIWHSVTGFSIFCYRSFPTPVGAPDQHKPSNMLRLRLGNSIELHWWAAPENRQPVELTYSRLIHFLGQLPVNRGYSSRFTDTPEPEPEPEPKPQPHWWNPIRAPRSIIDWLALATAGTILAAGIIALLARLL